MGGMTKDLYAVYLSAYILTLTGRAPCPEDGDTTEVLQAAALGIEDAIAYKENRPPRIDAEAIDTKYDFGYRFRYEVTEAVKEYEASDRPGHQTTI